MTLCGLICRQEAPVVLEGASGVGSQGPVGAQAVSACLNSGQDGGACTLLWKGECCSRLFIILVRERGNPPEEFSTASGHSVCAERTPVRRSRQPAGGELGRRTGPLSQPGAAVSQPPGEGVDTSKVPSFLPWGEGPDSLQQEEEGQESSGSCV